MRTLRFPILLLLLASFVTDASAQQGPELTPEEAVRLGLEHNRRIQAARADADGARQAFRQTRASRLPSLRVTGDYRRLLGDIPQAEFTFPGIDTTFAILPIPRDQVYSEVTLEQPLFQGMRLRNQSRAAEFEADAAELRADQVEADVALAVRSAYWILYRALADQETSEAALARVGAHLREVENLFQEGVILRSDLLAARTRRSQVLLERVEANNAVRVARLELSRLVGLPPGSEIQPATDVDTTPPPLELDLDELTQRALEERPQLRALSRQVRALERQVGVARGAWLPEVSLLGRYIHARPNPLVFAELDEFRGIGQVGVLMRWSLFEGGRRTAQTAEARARLSAAEARFADARDEVAVEVARQYLEALRAEEALAVAAEHSEHADESFRVVSQQFAEGVVLSSQVLEAEQVQRAARAQEAAAVAQHAIARAALLNALGQVW